MCPIKFSLTNPVKRQKGAIDRPTCPESRRSPSNSAPGRSFAACCKRPRSARPTTSPLPPVRASLPSPRPSDTPRAANPPRWKRVRSRIQSHCCRRPQTQSPAGNAGKPIADPPQPRRWRPHGLRLISQMRISHARTLVRPPTNPANEAFHRAGRHVPAPLPCRPGARNRLGQASPVPWAAYNRAGSHACQNESGASRCF
jgi:hypothetical protein